MAASVLDRLDRPMSVAVSAVVLLCALASCSGSGPRAIHSSGHGDGGHFVVVTRDGSAGHVEPDVASDPRNPDHLLGACQFEISSTTRVPGSFVSFDGARSWVDQGPLPLPAGYDGGADTTVGFDDHGTGFVVALLSAGGGGYPSRVSRGGIFVWHTKDGGRSFDKPTPVYVAAGFQDHPWLAVDRSSPVASLFIAWTNQQGLQLSISRDDGATFSRPHVLVAGGAPSNPVLTIGPEHVVEAFYEVFTAFGQPIRLYVIRSTNSGAAFSAPMLIGSVATPPASGGPKGNSDIPPPLFGVSTDPVTGQSAIAISGQDQQAGHPVINLWRSTGTAPWQGPIHPAEGVGAGATQLQPRPLYIDGQLFISYFATSRTGRTAEQLIRQPVPAHVGFAAVSLNAGAFSTAGFIGDYQALTGDGHRVLMLWNDAVSGRLQIVARSWA